jgi:hypothetical protein
MQFMTINEFSAWASQRGIGVISPDGASAGAYYWLNYLSSPGDGRFWGFPWEKSELLALIARVLNALDPWQSCWVFKREGGWSYAEDGDGRDVILHSIGIPEGFQGAVGFAASEKAGLILLLVTQIAFGWYVLDDVWVVPDHGRQMIYTDHDGAVHVRFAEVERVDSFVQTLAKNGFPLPEEPPNETFRWPDWMGPKPPDWPC